MAFDDRRGRAVEDTRGSGHRLQLSNGQPAYAGVVLGVFVYVGLVVMAVGVVPLLQSRSAGRGSALVMAGAMGAVGVAIMLVGVLFASFALGARQWLEGTSLVTKVTWRTTTVDLSRVEVGLNSLPLVERSKYAATTLGRSPTLMCRPDGEEWVTIPLTFGGGRIMPRSHLLAIADAVLAGRSASPQARAVVSHLRRLADTPLGRGALPPDWPGSTSD